jgi:acetyl-CoA acetyltransferase
MTREVAILGVGMHPWGKWGRNFVEYGVHAARAALKDAAVPWGDVQFISGAATMRCGYPGYVAGATFAQALGWQGAQVNTSYAAFASDSTPSPRRATDPLRGLRTGPRGRRGYHAQGLSRRGGLPA